MTHKIYIPNLNDLISENYYSYIDSEKLNTYMVPEVNNTTKNIRRDTLIDLLFHDDYPYNSYSIYFKRVNASYFEKNIRDRLLGTSKLIVCYIPASATEIDLYMDGEEDHSIEIYELFNLTNAAKVLIDNLNYFKQSGYMLDENLFEIYMFNELGNLSKLIYINLLILMNDLSYLDLIYTLNVDTLNSIELLYLEQLYTKIYSFLIRNNYLLGNTVVNSKIKSITVNPGDDLINNREIIINDDIIDNKISVKCKNLVLRKDVDYSLVNDGNQFKIVFINDAIILDNNEPIRLRYYFHSDLQEYSEMDLKQKNTGFYLNE